MRPAKGARLWLEPERRDKDGKLYQSAVWVIRDGPRKISTGCARDERAQAEEKLGEYIASKYQVPRVNKRHPAQILVLDVLNMYMVDVAPKHSFPEETKSRLLTLGQFFETNALADINGERCRAYVSWRTQQFRKASKPDKTGRAALRITEATARRELEDLRAAINYHRNEGYCSEIVAVALPEKAEPRDVWLMRQQAARLIWAAWRAKQVMPGGVTARATGKHIARFILVGLYTGTRHAAITGAALTPAIGRGHVDLERGVFHRRPAGAVETKKRQPPVRLPDRLLAHLRRWERQGIAKVAVVEWNREPVHSVRKGFAAAAKAAGLPTSGPNKVTPHVLRHTAATWGMQNRANLWELAGFLDMTPEMLWERYGHHHPDFQKDAARAVTASPSQKLPRQFPDRKNVNKGRQT